MKIMYYPNTLSNIREKINQSFPNSKPKEGPEDSNNIYNHILWMLNEIEKMDANSIFHATKAGRWIGWILSKGEGLSIWSNNESRDMIRIDVKNGTDIPKNIIQ